MSVLLDYLIVLSSMNDEVFYKPTSPQTIYIFPFQYLSFFLKLGDISLLFCFHFPDDRKYRTVCYIGTGHLLAFMEKDLFIYSSNFHTVHYFLPTIWKCFINCLSKEWWSHFLTQIVDFFLFTSSFLLQ